MKIKLQLKRTPDSAPEYYYTNLFVVTEWERLERRNIQQLSTQPLYSDYCCWMHTILKHQDSPCHRHSPFTFTFLGVSKSVPIVILIRTNIKKLKILLI